MKYLEKFETYQKAVNFYKRCSKVKLPYYLKDQLNRASGTITQMARLSGADL